MQLPKRTVDAYAFPRGEGNKEDYINELGKVFSIYGG